MKTGIPSLSRCTSCSSVCNNWTTKYVKRTRSMIILMILSCRQRSSGCWTSNKNNNNNNDNDNNNNKNLFSCFMLSGINVIDVIFDV